MHKELNNILYSYLSLLLAHQVVLSDTENIFPSLQKWRKIVCRVGEKNCLPRSAHFNLLFAAQYRKNTSHLIEIYQIKIQKRCI